MPLSSKLRADYIELINQLLDAVPVTKPADFRAAIDNFSKILGNGGGVPDFVPTLKDSMESIHDCLMQPEMYVQSPTDYVEYQQIMKDRIQAKITEFTSFTPAQQYEYVRTQQALRERAASHQEKIVGGESKRRGPRYVETEEEMLARMQREFQQGDMTWFQDDEQGNESRTRTFAIDPSQLATRPLGQAFFTDPRENFFQRVVLRIRRETESLERSNAILAEYPENIGARLTRASIFESQNLTNQALQDYRYVLQQYPANRIAQHGVERFARREAEYFEARRQVADTASREYGEITGFFRRPTPHQELPRGGTATTHHVIGNLYFKIVELDRPDDGETHLLCPIYNGREAITLTTGLKPEHISLIMNNLHNIGELKNIFTTVINGTNVNSILSILNIAERESANRPGIS